MSLPFSKLRIFGKQVLNHLKDEEGPNSLNNLKNIYSQVKSDELMRILTSRLSETDLYKVIFISFFMDKDMELSQIEKIVTNDLLLFKLTNYDSPSTKRDSCDDCYGYGNIECDSCEGEGDITCISCDGSGNEECNECDGSGEDSEGESCGSCGGDGITDCKDCYGDGKNECSFCDGDGQNSCDYCDGSGEVETNEEYYDANILTFITNNNYVLSIKEDTILTNEVADELFDGNNFYKREYESNDETLDEITSRYEGEPEDESDFYVLTSPPIKI
jgi:hypothetical protein